MIKKVIVTIRAAFLGPGIALSLVLHDVYLTGLDKFNLATKILGKNHNLKTRSI
jgi:hypothetical protein